MAHVEYFKDGSGNTIIPVAAADFYTDDMSLDFEHAYFIIKFYDSADVDTLATPGAGTIEFTGTPGLDKDTALLNYLDVDNGAFNGVDVYSQSRIMPLAIGPMRKAKLTLAGITVATHFRAWVVRY